MPTATAAQRAILHAALQRYFDDQREAGTPKELVDVLLMDVPTRRAALQPYVDAIKAEVADRLTQADADAANRKAALQAQHTAATTVPL